MSNSKLTISGHIGLVSTKQKRYVHYRKGFYRNGKYIKGKKSIKYKEIPIKNPRLNFNVFLRINEALIIGGTYTDEHGENYACTQVSHIPETESVLLNICTKPKDNTIYFLPTKLIHQPK